MKTGRECLFPPQSAHHHRPCKAPSLALFGDPFKALAPVGLIFTAPLGALKRCTIQRHSQITPRCFSHTFTIAPDSPLLGKTQVDTYGDPIWRSFMLLCQPHVERLLIGLQGRS